MKVWEAFLIYSFLPGLYFLRGKKADSDRRSYEACVSERFTEENRFSWWGMWWGIMNF